jgi:AbrB family looped-hinge helix DNA binding protein
MKSVGAIRALDSMGRVVIPQEVRRAINAHEGQKFEFYLTNDDDVLLRKYIDTDNRPIKEIKNLVATLYTSFRLSREEILDLVEQSLSEVNE